MALLAALEVAGHTLTDTQVVLLGTLVVVVAWSVYNRKRTNAPGPFEWPLIGYVVEMWWNRPRCLDWLLDLSDKYGDTFTLWGIGSQRFIATCKVENVEHALKTNFENYEKGPEFADKFREVLGEGIFAVDGARWRVQRKTAAHMFSVRSFNEHMTHVFQGNAERVVELLMKTAANQSYADVQNMLFRFTLDSIGEIAFGVNVNSLAQPTNPFAMAFDKAQAVSESRFFEPHWKLKRAFGHADEVALKRGARVMNDFCLDIINKRKNESDQQLSGRKDLLSRFIELKDKEGNRVCSDKVLRDVIMNFMIAGRDTTANAMSWTVYMLDKNPRVKAKFFEEIDSMPDNIQYDDVRNMPYTQAIIKETLRLYPSVPKNAKTCLKDDVLPDGTFCPKGALFVWMPYVMGRKQSIWGKDCLEYRPERFIETPNPPAFKFTAFNAGPRICLGRNMAMFEATMTLATIYKRVDLRVQPGLVCKPLSTVTCPIAGQLLVTAVPRQSSRS